VSVRDKIYMSIATVGGVGYTPLCPGTAASLVAVVVFLVLQDTRLFFIFTLASLFLAFYVSGKAERIIGEKDSKRIVIDDFSGMLLALLFIPHTAPFIITAFFLFRAIDMVKLPPADRLEKLSGSRGVVGDDIAAGIYTNVLLQIVRILLQRCG